MSDKNELDVINNALSELVETSSLDVALKPLVNEIHLFDSYVAGIDFVKHALAIDDLEVDEKLLLKRVPSKYDDNEIMIYRSNGAEIGRIPEQDNIIFARLLDGGKKLTAKVKTYEFVNYKPKITIGIYLEDF